MKRAKGHLQLEKALAGISCLLMLFASPSAAQLAPEPIGQIERLPTPFDAHWMWVSDAIMERTTLVDLEAGRTLGMIDGGWGLTAALFPQRNEIYVPETHYSRGSRGRRTDVLTIYQADTLAPVGEVILPPKRAMNPLPTGNAALSDDDRFAAIFNMTPATSLSIVDVVARRLVGEIATPGCSLVYGAGPRRFAMLCGDGAMLLIDLDAQGQVLSKVRSAPFFDPQADPVTEKAVRRGDTWIFVSFEGMIHEVDVSGTQPRFAEPWSLTPQTDDATRWRIGGRQFLAVHEATGKLYSLMHPGPKDSHKQDGSEVWIFDLASHERIARIELRSPGFTFLGVPLEFGQDWIWPFNHLYGALVDLTASAIGIGEIAVTQDDAPLLVTAGPFSGSVAKYDALTGDFLGRVVSGNMTSLILQAPPWPLPASLAQNVREERR
jgi:methylamine dehydrogenase heavy chain